MRHVRFTSLTNNSHKIFNQKLTLKLNEIFEEAKGDEDLIDLNSEKQKIKDKKQKLHLTQKEVNRMLIRRFNQHSSLVLKASERLKTTD